MPAGAGAAGATGWCRWAILELRAKQCQLGLLVLPGAAGATRRRWAILEYRAKQCQLALLVPPGAAGATRRRWESLEYKANHYKTSKNPSNASAVWGILIFCMNYFKILNIPYCYSP